MSKTAKMVIGLIVLIIIVVLIWIISSNSTPAQLPPTTSQDQTSNSANSEAVSETLAPTPTDGTGLSASGDTSDTAIDQDTQAVDAQIKGLDSDSANVDQSLSASAASTSLSL